MPFQFDVLAIMKTRSAGIRAAKEITTKHVLTAKTRKLVGDICSTYMIDNFGTSPSSEMKEAMALGIITAFPCLKDPQGKGYESWYIKGSNLKGKKKLSAKGTLEDRLKYLRTLKKSDEECKGEPVENVDKVATVKEYDCQQMKTHTEWLKHNSESVKVTQLMKETAVFRRDYIHGLHGEEEPELATILEQFPHLLKPGMIEQDYGEIFPEKAQLLYQKWSTMSACVLSYSGSTTPAWKSRFDIEADDSSFQNDERMNLAFFNLPLLFGGRKAKGVKVSFRETLEYFIDVQKEGVSVERYLNDLPKARSQPYVLVLGGTYKKPQQQFVIIEKKTLETGSLLSAIDLCYKAHQVLDLKYAIQANNVWVFLDSLVFGVKTSNEAGSIKAFRAYYHYTSK